MTNASYIGTALLCLVLTGCSVALHQPMQVQPARLGANTEVTEELKSLPIPDQKIVAAVYKFRDQTGQYKPSETGASWSTAVTQGATNILIKAMEDSGWFLPIERENIGNLLNERQIIRSTRNQYEGNNGNQPVLPPLLFAGIILEGGIISYDSNVLTGGAGLRYFGAGGSGKYRQDRITVYLRAISTNNGKVLKTVYVSKTLLSQALDGGIFRYVQFRRLLEAETGFTYNEPTEMALMEAIEKAVHTMIIEGLMEGMWLTAPSDSTKQEVLIQNYLAEKEAMASTGYLGQEFRKPNWNYSVDLAGNGNLYQGDLPNPRLQPGLSLGITWNINSSLLTSFQTAFGQLGTEGNYQENFLQADLSVGAKFLPNQRITPIVSVGAGVISDDWFNNTQENLGGGYFPKVHWGLGLQFQVSDKLALFVNGSQQYLLNDNLDSFERGRLNDYFWQGQFGVQFLMGAPSLQN